ncbi:LysR family transcriptional regulator [Micrococcales bacterium 31B]|nr:LysR family transcriptional regulator [Micrococcales bacterium 31B]
MLDLHRLRLLRDLSQLGTISSVAASLGYTASAVSQHLATLEKEVGIKLLEPHGRRVRLTPQGEILVRHAEGILASVEAAEAELQSSQDEVVGTFRLACFQSAAMALVPDAVKFLHDRHPRLRLEFAAIECLEALEAVQSREFDIVIVEDLPGGAMPRPAGLQFSRIMQDELVIAVGPLEADDPTDRAVSAVSAVSTVSTERLAAARWVLEPEGTLSRASTIDLCRDLGFEPDAPFESTDMMMHMRLFATGQAVGILPRLALMHSQVPLRVASFPGGPLMRTIYAATRAGSLLHPAIASTIDALRLAAAGLGMDAPAARRQGAPE